MGCINEEHGIPKQAATEFKESREMYQTVYENETAHPIIEVLLENLADLYSVLGNHEEASILHLQNNRMNQTLYDGNGVLGGRNITNLVANL